MTAQDLNEFLKSKRYDRVKNFSLKHDRVDNLDTGETFSFDMEINEFNMKICKAFGVTGLP